MPAKGHPKLESELLHYGINCRGDGVHFFDGKESAEHLDYLDLVGMGRSGGAGEPVRPDGVAENQGRPRPAIKRNARREAKRFPAALLTRDNSWFE